MLQKGEARRWRSVEKGPRLSGLSFPASLALLALGLYQLSLI